MMDKKAQAVWISWVLLIGMVVVTSVIVGRFYLSTAESTSETIKGFLQDSEACKDVGVSVVKSCQVPEALNIEVANIGTINVDKLVFRIYSNSYDSESATISGVIEPGDTENLSVGKSWIAAKVDIIPLVEEEDSIIICSSRLAELDNIPDC